MWTNFYASCIPDGTIYKYMKYYPKAVVLISKSAQTEACRVVLLCISIHKHMCKFTIFTHHEKTPVRPIEKPGVVERPPSKINSKRKWGLKHHDNTRHLITSLAHIQPAGVLFKLIYCIISNPFKTNLLKPLIK